MQLVARIKGVNKIIWFEKCGGFGGCFYAFNEFGELYFCASRCTLRSQCSVQLVARIKCINKIICFEKCGVFMGLFIRLINLMSYIFVHQDARYGLNVAYNLLHE